MTFPQLARFTDVALLLLRLMVAIVFLTSGWEHLRDPVGRSKDIGMSKGFPIFFGCCRMRRGVGLDIRNLDGIGCYRFDSCNAWRPQKDFRLAYRVLG